MSKKYKILHLGKYVKEADYTYLVECPEKDASLFTEKIADEIIGFLGSEARKIEVLDLDYEK